ncbi:hypothetical protein HDU80_004467 [Chytriomyces hyalinus]|nr:hypothetical protein HDU80_004467 [Chytriomyces hyalinus]
MKAPTKGQLEEQLRKAEAMVATLQATRGLNDGSQAAISPLPQPGPSSTSAAAARVAQKAAKAEKPKKMHLQYTLQMVETLFKLKYKTHATKFGRAKSKQQLGCAWEYLAADFNRIHVKDLKLQGFKALDKDQLQSKHGKLKAEYTEIKLQLAETGNSSADEGKTVPEYYEVLCTYLDNKKGLGNVDYGQSEVGVVIVGKGRKAGSDDDNAVNSDTES